MAALSSTQSGNWSSSATWGGVTPADGDTFTINRGHEVTVNSDIRTTDGFGDIEVYGHLKFTTNAKMRLNGRITVKGYNTAAYNVAGGAWFADGNSSTAGLFSSSGSNMMLEVRGNNADQHGIWVENERFASMKLQADEVRTTTALSASVETNDSYLAVLDSTGIAAEDWIAVYEEQQDNRVLGDEGFFVHDVDTANNRVYVRQFVTPTATIQAVNGSTVTVDNAKVFREGYVLICGTQSTRVVATVTAINYSTNKLTMSSTYTSSHIGETMYQTGLEKYHSNTNKVQKLATTLTTAITTADSTNQIDVGSANDLSVGDSIIIDVNNDTDFGWDYDSEYTITAKSGTTLTLDDQVRHLHKVGSIIQKLDREFTIKGVDTSTDTRPFLYVEYWTDFDNAHTRHIGLKNIRFTQWGYNTNSTYYQGVMIAGYNSEKRDDQGSDNRYQYQSHVQGCVFDKCNNVNQSYTGLSFRHSHGVTCRNNLMYYVGNYQLWLWSSNHNAKIYNNYSTRSSYACIYTDSHYEPYTEFSYNYATRSDDYGIMLHHYREPVPIRHNYSINHENRAFYAFYWVPDSTTERWYIDGYRYIPYGGIVTHIQFLDSYMDNRWFKSVRNETAGLYDADDYFGWAGQDGRNHLYRADGTQQCFESFEHNFEYDAKLEYYGGGSILKTSNSSVMKVFHHTSNDYPVYSKQVYVPANTTVRISAEMKFQAGGSYSSNFFLTAQKVTGYRHAVGRWRTAYTGQTSTLGSDHGDAFYSFLENSSFDVSSKGVWQERQITVEPQSKGYFLFVGIMGMNDSRQEKHELKDINIFFDQSPTYLKEGTPGRRVSVRSGFTRAKKRIGGTRL